MKKYANVEEIRRNAIEVKDGMMVYWPQEQTTEPLALGEIPFKFERKFDMNNGILSFVLEGKVYVIPEMWEHTQLCSQKDSANPISMYPSAMEIIRWHMKLSGKSCLKSRERA